MLAVAENPPMLPPGVQTLADMTGTWWIAHTKSRAEKAFCWELLGQGIGFFLPIVEKITFSGGRKRLVMHPMFPSYVFFTGDRAARYSALSTNRLCQVLEVKNQETFMKELTWIETAVNGKATLDTYPHAAVGKRCRVRSGPLLGVEGVVVERSSMTHLALQVSMLGQGALLQIHPDLLEPVY
jgi:transcription antitermination factor NusG